MNQTRKLSVWITGSAGFLGTKLASRFTSTGHAVVGLSRRPSSPVEKSVVIDLAANDTCDRLRELVQNVGVPDVLIHAASKQPGSGNLREFLKANVLTTRNLLEVFRTQPPRHIIYTSTQTVYNRPEKLPVKETAPAGGTLPYSATKRWSEQLLEELKDVVAVTVLRLPSLYGVGQTDSFIDGLARQALVDKPIELFSGGRVVRDALHVNDVVRAVLTCAENQVGQTFSVLNLGCGRRITTLEYARALVAALESKSPIIPIDKPASQPDLYADIEQARRMIGFEPTSLEESLKTYANELSAR